MPFPLVAIGPAVTVLGWGRDLHQRRRKVRLTVHRAHEVTGHQPSGEAILGRENYYIRVMNASPERDIVVTHIWMDTNPRVDVIDAALPVRMRHSAPWETAIPVDKVPGDPDEALWLARCRLAPDDKVVKSRPRIVVPPGGTVPRG
jgi:hypothetical protein